MLAPAGQDDKAQSSSEGAGAGIPVELKSGCSQRARTWPAATWRGEFRDLRAASSPTSKPGEWGRDRGRGKGCNSLIKPLLRPYSSPSETLLKPYSNFINILLKPY